MNKIDLSIVIPAYNEQRNLEKGVLEKISSYLNKQKYSWELLVVDDKSSDDTVKLAEKFAENHDNFRVLKESHRGKGGTVIAGMLAVKGEIILFTDMDQATPLNQIEKFFPEFEKGSDIVIGSRTGREGAPIVRKMMAYGFMVLRTLILRLPYKDTQCGFKAFKKDAAKKIFNKMKIFSEKMETKGASVTAGFDLEILYLARKLNLRVSEVAVKWRHQEGSKVNPIKDSWEGLRDLLRVRLNAILGVYQLGK